MTHDWKLWNHYAQDGEEVNDEISQVVMCVMCAEQKEDNRNAEEELLGWSVLIAVVDLLPHVEVVVSPSIKLEGHATDPVEHEERAEHVRDIGQSP